MLVLLPKGIDLDLITQTWLRGLVATALERRIRPLCWHFEHESNAAVATGYVTMTLLDKAPEIRRQWAEVLGLTEISNEGQQPGGFEGRSGNLIIRLPDSADPDEHCRVCLQPFDPQDLRPDGQGSTRGGDICRRCATDTPSPVGSEPEANMRKTAR